MPSYQGTAGDDIFNGAGDNDFFDMTPSGNDVVHGGDGLDRFQLGGTHGVGSGAFYGDAGRDEFVINDFGTDFTVNLYGGADDDLFQLQSGAGAVIDAGDGDDVVRLIAGSASVTFGAGHDLAILEYTATGLIIQDFTISGASSDRLDLAEFLAWNNSTQAWNGVDNPFTAGYLRLTQSGADTLVEYGNPFGYQTLVTLKGVTSTDLTASSLGGFDPAGGASIGLNITGDGTDETLRGLAGNNILDGAGGDDTIIGGAGSDQLYGGDGDDVIRDIRGAAVTMWGGEGADTLVFTRSGVARPGTAALLNGGAGSDTITATVYNAAYNGTITLQGGDGDDVISLSGATAGTLEGGAGDDVLTGGDGIDYLDGGDGSDTASYRAAAAGIRATLGVALSTSTGTPVSDGFESIENLTGSRFNDALGGDDGANVLIGGEGADEIFGGDGDDLIHGDDDSFGAAGDDTLDGGDGVDTVSYRGAAAGVTVSLAVTTAQNTGGAGVDTLSGFENLVGSFYDDVLTGDDGANVLSGGSGIDVLNGGAGDDILIDSHGDGAFNGGDGSDTVTFLDSTNEVQVDLSNTGSQQVVGNWGYHYTFNSIENLVGSRYDDRLTGDATANVLEGGDGADELRGGLGADTLRGQNGNDTLYGGADNDVLEGGDGDDILDGGDGQDALDGGAGNDTASYATATTTNGVSVSLSTAAPQSDSTVITDTFTSVENLTGSAYNDVLKGDAAANVLDGGSGHDSLFGEGGNDILRGGLGQDNLLGGMGDDLLDGGADNDFANYSDIGYFTPGIGLGVTVTLGVVGPQDTIGAGVDTLVSIESLTGSQYADILTGDAAANVLYGQGGDDVLRGEGGNDQIFGQDGDDLIEGGAGQDYMDGGAGSDTVSYANHANGVGINLTTAGWFNTGGNVLDYLANFENVIGTAFGDTLTGTDGDNVLRGMAGRDFLVGGGGDDTLDGGDGVDDAIYLSATSGVTVSLAITTAQNTGGAGVDTLTGIENLTGGAYNDVLTGDAGDNVLRGQDGDDILDGGAGDDALVGGLGVDTATYASASAGVTVDLAVTTVQNTGGAGADALIGIENLVGSAFDDILAGDAANNTLDGGLGSDTLFGGAGADILRDGGETTNRDFLYGGAGNDTYYVTSSFTGPTDLVYEGAAVAGAEGGVGDIDVIHSNGEFFWDFYGVAEELYIDRAAGSQMVGGTNDQKFFGNTGTDVMLVYGGSNRIDAGAGTDVIGLSLYGLDESYDGVNTVVMKAGSGIDYVYDFESGVDKIDLTAFNFGITGQQVLDQAVNVDLAGTADDHVYFYLTSAGGVDNFIVFMGLQSSQLSAADFITGTV